MSGRRISFEDFLTLMGRLGAGVPDSQTYTEMGACVVDLPGHEALSSLDPLSDGYRRVVMDLYLRVRGWEDEGYEAIRDERPSAGPPANVWTDLVPWSFRDVGMAAEHLSAWGHILSELKVAPGGSVLEYGPGSGQMLLMLARMGYRASGVDVDGAALDTIQAQARPMGLDVRTEKAVFGAGFEGERFDAILFYEAFHHALDFQALLEGLRGRLNPGGRLVLGGEPILAEACPIMPYPWGLRLDALSLFCVRRFGWMELGFTDDFFRSAARGAGWNVTRKPLPNCPRGALYVLDDGTGAACRRGVPSYTDLVAANEALERSRAGLATAKGQIEREIELMRQVLADIRASTSWRVTAPMRAVAGLLRRKGR